jgi:cardiolipin synthase
MNPRKASNASLAGAPFARETERLATIPNLLTVLRLLLILPFAWLGATGRDVAALVVCFIAGLTDALDGKLARKLGQASKWGRLADPIADKVLTSVAFIVLSLFREGLTAIPLWVMLAVVARDVMILIGCGIVYAAARTSAFQPTVSGKANTAIEILVVVCFLAATVLPFLAAVLPVLYVLLLISLLISGGDYVLQGARMIGSSKPR